MKPLGRPSCRPESSRARPADLTKNGLVYDLWVGNLHRPRRWHGGDRRHLRDAKRLATSLRSNVKELQLAVAEFVDTAAEFYDETAKTSANCAEKVRVAFVAMEGREALLASLAYFSWL